LDPDRRFSELVAPLRDDVESGASVLARTAADVLRRASVRVQAGSLDELRWSLGIVSALILDAQPAMAPLVALVRDVMGAVENATSLEAGRHAAASAADGFRSAFPQRAAAVAEAARDILPAGGTVATVSSSATVRHLLESEAAPRGVGVLCFESRPVREGRPLAAALAEAGVDVTYAVDASIALLVPECDAVLIGADSIGDRGVVNKIGSAAASLAARAAGVPLYVLADETKLLPRGFPQPLDDDRPGREVWPEAHPGVRVWNRYFEVVPTADVTAVVTEAGVWSPEELEAARDDLRLPAGLVAWARARGTGAAHTLHPPPPVV
jgi:translation initiation factor 2B subunit (eIF-2B alpha/beta/delta family)